MACLVGNLNPEGERALADVDHFVPVVETCLVAEPDQRVATEELLIAPFRIAHGRGNICNMHVDYVGDELRSPDISRPTKLARYE